MISSFFISIAANILGFILYLLPVSHLPSSFNDAVIYFWGVINSFSYVLPVDTLLQVTLLILSVEAFLILFHIARWVFKHIPFLGH